VEVHRRKNRKKGAGRSRRRRRRKGRGGGIEWGREGKQWEADGDEEWDEDEGRMLKQS